MDDFDRGYRPGLRRIEIVRSNVYSANQTNITYTTPRLPPPEARSPEPPLTFPPHKGRRKPPSASIWCFSDPEMKRRRRVAGYKVYSVEGKVKASFRKGFRWIKCKCSELVHGW